MVSKYFKMKQFGKICSNGQQRVKAISGKDLSSNPKFQNLSQITPPTTDLRY
jgi:hypothetical protein